MNAKKSTSPGKTFGIVGGLGSLAGADLFYKLISSRPVLADQGRYHFLFEQHPFKDVLLPLDRDASMSSRKFYAFQMCQSLENGGADAILLPCIASHTFREEIQAELGIPVFDLLHALRQQVERTLPEGGRLGILTSDYVRHSGLFERYFADRHELVYPGTENQARLMEAMYGVDGIKDGQFDGAPLEHLHQVCVELQEQGVALILPGLTELSLVSQDLQRRGIALLDANRVYSDYAIHASEPAPAPRFKLGIVGGVGPAATVDFMAKVIRHTPADRDQEHIRMVVEQNPQIPDRTANLLHQATDPSMALYATCKRLEQEGAHAIAIPCNTAHAFVERIQPYLKTPIINMLDVTIRHIAEQYGAGKSVGLLATSGTVQSRVYHDVARQWGLQLIVPQPAMQARVMAAIYGERGVKAGHTDGLCREQLLEAANHLCQAGASVLILGCTELPLILPHAERFVLDSGVVSLVDPTTLLALRCVQQALETPQRRSADAVLLQQPATAVVE
ncbi:aspartate/glutamate racemase family protein [Pseudomonas asplenii]|uniref:aspartate/glutamate racemase family protein n=1 Tax=Pseudomonas asplenii TaxID=53407 RepID=UPI00236069C5|nr:amino acid racemase [Pseudomonas asplenii]